MAVDNKTRDEYGVVGTSIVRLRQLMDRISEKWAMRDLAEIERLMLTMEAELRFAGPRVRMLPPWFPTED